jgi:hypothetical protein
METERAKGMGEIEAFLRKMKERQQLEREAKLGFAHLAEDCV